MALINIKFASEVLGRCTDINVVIPQRRTSGEIGIKNNAKDKQYKTLLLLHGLSDDNTIWLRRTSIERYAVERGIAVVLPSADRSFYTDMRYGDKFYTYISEEVLRVAREYLPLSDKREDNFVAGLSMGGYGALKIGLRNPDKFAACAGLSSVVDAKALMENYASSLLPLVFGKDGIVPDEDNLYKLAEKCENETQKPRIYMGVGRQDFLYNDNLAFKNFMENKAFDFTYTEAEGAHTWAFWDEHIQYVLGWMLRKQ